MSKKISSKEMLKQIKRAQASMNNEPKNVIEEIFPLVLAVREIRKVNWITTSLLQEALAMNILVKSMKK